MKTLVISDLHADVEALDKVLLRAKKLGCEQILCAGDLVDGGLFPDELCSGLMREAVPTIRGNHDRWALAHAAGERPAFGGGFDLAPQTLSFLSALPTSWRGVLAGTSVAMWHGSPKSDMHGISAADAPRVIRPFGAEVVIVGHTHEPFSCITQAGELLCNPGSLASPAFVEKGGGTFGILELPHKRFTIHNLNDED